VLLVNGDLPREMPFTEKSSRNTFIIGAVHLLSITYKMGQIMCFYINTHLLSTEPFSFCDMVPPLMVNGIHAFVSGEPIFSESFFLIKSGTGVNVEIFFADIQKT